MSLHQMLRKKLSGSGSSSPSLELLKASFFLLENVGVAGEDLGKVVIDDDDDDEGKDDVENKGNEGEVK